LQFAVGRGRMIYGSVAASHKFISSSGALLVGIRRIAGLFSTFSHVTDIFRCPEVVDLTISFRAFHVVEVLEAVPRRRNR